MMIDLPKAPEYPVLATLHFLPGGHYLFRSESNGKAAKFVTAADVRAAFNQREEDTGWLPAGVVRCGHNADGPWYAYSAPAQTVKLAIEGRAEPLSAPMPRTVLIGSNGQHWLVATQTKHFDPAAAAYRMPTPNVYANSGSVCWGSSRPGPTKPANARKDWQMFFDSIFSTHLVDGKSNSCPRDVITLLVELAGHKGHKGHKFPAGELVEMGMNVAGLLKQVIGGEA